MYFHKYPHPANFEFVPKLLPNRHFQMQGTRYRLTVAASAEDIYRIGVSGGKWLKNDAIARLKLPRKVTKLSGKETQLDFLSDGSVSLKDRQGNLLLESLPNMFFGQKGEASIFAFLKTSEDQYYGMGEKWSRLEHSNKTTKFWNTDVWSDFHEESYIHGKPDADPAYVSIPYLIVKRGETYLGILLDNPHATFISTSYATSIAHQMEVSGAGHGCMYFGAEQGQPSLIIIHGPTLPALTRKLQKLVGTTPRPPAWALGYHQCRWGYESHDHLMELHHKFTEHEIPVDGLWLDIDYMDSYKVFTVAEKHFRDARKTIARLEKSGRKVVPIIDPGVKYEKGYGVFERGVASKAFCQNPQGKHYVGLVWPGETVFPDFSLAASRNWWAGEVRNFAELGFQGAWLDMNDPSTGLIDNLDMLFDHGRKNHSSFHNQYALGMAMASRDGFMQARPNERPFLLSRSGCTGSSRFAAIWTGDNYSNYHHLRNSIPVTLNLALSGIPFNGPDVGGFGGNTTPELTRDWYKAGFLFPFFRNHSVRDSRRQEPWAFDKRTLEVVRHYIRLRYRLRPYLYQLFIEQERSGEAILRPLFYDFQESSGLPLGKVDDQFMVGPSVMQAPFVVAKQTEREVVLPSTKWFDLSTGKWLEGDRIVHVSASLARTPIYIRDSTILPLARLKPDEHAFRPQEIDFQIFLSSDGEVETRYIIDDGSTFDYATGLFSEIRIAVSRAKRSLEIQVATLKEGFGKGDFAFICESTIQHVKINGKPARKIAPIGMPLGAGRTHTWQCP